MSILTCWTCGQTTKVDDQNAGTSRTCPACGSNVAFPKSSPSAAPLPEPLHPSRQAASSVVLAIVGLLFLWTGVGIVLCVIARQLGRAAVDEIDRTDGPPTRRDAARAGALLGSFGAILGAVLIAAAMVMVLPEVFAQRNGCGCKMKNGTQVRGVVNALVLWSASPTQTDDFPRKGVGNCTGDSVIARYSALCTVTNGDPLSPKLLLNPAGTDVLAANAANLRSTNISYALLDPGNAEWKNLTNAGAPLVCDKQVGAGSYYSKNVWQGNVGWGDVHTTFETSPVVSTMMGGTAYPQDDLWKQSTTNDALMINP
jgi:hypothetical protein